MFFKYLILGAFSFIFFYECSSLVLKIISIRKEKKNMRFLSSDKNNNEKGG